MEDKDKLFKVVSIMFFMCMVKKLNIRNFDLEAFKEDRKGVIEQLIAIDLGLTDK